MGDLYIILDLDKLKIVSKWGKSLTFDCYSDAFKYAKKYIKNFKLIKL